MKPNLPICNPRSSHRMIFVGTSGYNYPEWKGSFYPADLAAAKMLPYYAARFPTVEINYTFYRMPSVQAAGRMDQAGAGVIQVHAQGAAPHHARREARQLRGSHGGVLPRRRHARRSARRAAVSAAAVAEERPCAARRVSRHASAQGARGVRVPASVVVRCRGVRASEGARQGALRRRQRKAGNAARSDRRLRLLPTAGRGLSGAGHRAVGDEDRAACEPGARTSTCTSSTKSRASARSSPAS